MKELGLLLPTIWIWPPTSPPASSLRRRRRSSSVDAAGLCRTERCSVDRRNADTLEVRAEDFQARLIVLVSRGRSRNYSVGIREGDGAAGYARRGERVTIAVRYQWNEVRKGFVDHRLGHVDQLLHVGCISRAWSCDCPIERPGVVASGAQTVERVKDSIADSYVAVAAWQKYFCGVPQVKKNPLLVPAGASGSEELRVRYL